MTRTIRRSVELEHFFGPSTRLCFLMGRPEADAEDILAIDFRLGSRNGDDVHRLAEPATR